MKHLFLPLTLSLSLSLTSTENATPKTYEKAIPQFQSLEEAAKHFKDNKLCFIGRLDQYTDRDMKKINPHKSVVSGMTFSILWNAKKQTQKTYWMHICFEPVMGEIFGKRDKIYAVTLEGPAKFGKGDVNNWPICANAFKFTEIQIKPDKKKTGKK